MKRSWMMVLVLPWLATCTTPPLPGPAPVQFSTRVAGRYVADTLAIEVRNTTGVPLLLRLGSREPAYQRWVPNDRYPLAPYEVRTLFFGPIPDSVKTAIGPTLSTRPLLDTAWVTPDPAARYRYPFPAGKRYAVMQAYYGTVSHDQVDSRYALDFALPVGDTVCAARDGIVIEMASQNTVRGKDRSFAPYANYLTLYHADGVVSQYVHLRQDGILVGIGDSVRAGQPIGIAGFTGYTTAPHLHFNVCIGLGEQRRSIPVQFFDRPGATLRPGEWVRNER